MEDFIQDKQAITRLKKGDLNGLDILVERYQLRAVRTAFLIVLDRPLAEDIVQEAFIRLVKKIDQFDERRSFGPWFLRIVVNDSLKAMRREARTISLDADNTGETLALIEGLSDQLPGPEDEVASKELSQEVRLALAQLPPAQRSVIVQRYFLGFSEAEMSLENKRPLGTIKWLVHNAHRRLRDLLQQKIEPAMRPSDPTTKPQKVADEE